MASPLPSPPTSSSPARIRIHDRRPDAMGCLGAFPAFWTVLGFAWAAAYGHTAPVGWVLGVPLFTWLVGLCLPLLWRPQALRHGRLLMRTGGSWKLTLKQRAMEACRSDPSWMRPAEGATRGQPEVRRIWLRSTREHHHIAVGWAPHTGPGVWLHDATESSLRAFLLTRLRDECPHMTWLHERGRARLLAAPLGDWMLHPGGLSLSLPVRTTTPEALLQRLADAAAWLDQLAAERVPEADLRALLADPHPRVRCGALYLHTTLPDVDDALIAPLLHDPAHFVRLQAALAPRSGSARWQTLHALTQEPSMRLHALLALLSADQLTPDEIWPLLKEPPLRRAALDALRRAAAPLPWDRAHGSLRADPNALLHFVGRAPPSDRPRALRWLCGGLDRADLDDIDAALSLLVRLGGPPEARWLHGRLAMRPARHERRALRRALIAIEERTRHISGHLALVESEDGALSMAPAPREESPLRRFS